MYIGKFEFFWSTRQCEWMQKLDDSIDEFDNSVDIEDEDYAYRDTSTDERGPLSATLILSTSFTESPEQPAFVPKSRTLVHYMK